jgi:hypothetical protein
MTRSVLRVLRVLACVATVMSVTSVPAAAAAEEELAAPQSGSPATLLVAGVLHSQRVVQWSAYPLTRLRDLRIVTRWYVVGPHVQRVDIVAPDGALYRQFRASFKHTNSRLEGTRVIIVMPVGGTWITEYSLVGTWQVRLYLDNARTPVLTQSFVLTP